MSDGVLPPGFRFGVATSGFQIEGGYNSPGEPANNWSWWELEGRVEHSGIALDFWRKYERQLDRAVAAGCDAFRLSVEWARCEPREGEIDSTAVDNYNAILDACHARGLQPLVSLHHFCHPAWLGVDFWLHPDSPERFAEWVRLAVDRFAGRCHHWVTINEPNVYAVQSYVLGMFPPGRRLNMGKAVRTLDHMLAAHVLAYEAVKERQPQAVVSTNTYPMSVYEGDRLLVDVLLSRSKGIGRYDLRPWLVERRREYHERSLPAPSRLEWLLRKRINSAVPMEQALPRAVAAVYDSACDRTLDVVQLDYYDPVVNNHVRVPPPKLWDDKVWPEGLARYVELNHEPGLDVWIVENGLCNRVKGSLSYTRQDGWTRPRYLKANLRAMVAAIDAGMPVGAYYHWTLADNYEWGSYEPRFGLYGVTRDPAGGGVEWSDLDSLGDDSAGAYRRIIEGLRAGDRSVLA
ncbi:MAG: family 1 glycosylhydrolase [Actinobacteria bacterium]|nr:family 1 glycosylhydrolase [Actinomycetota bacterium]